MLTTDSLKRIDREIAKYPPEQRNVAQDRDLLHGLDVFGVLHAADDEHLGIHGE